MTLFEPCHEIAKTMSGLFLSFAYISKIGQAKYFQNSLVFIPLMRTKAFMEGFYQFHCQKKTSLKLHLSRETNKLSSAIKIDIPRGN